MSLGGRDNQDPYMGLYEVLMLPAHDAEIAFLRACSNARAALASYLVDGRPTRDLAVRCVDVETGVRDAVKRYAPGAARGTGGRRVLDAHEREHAYR